MPYFHWMMAYTHLSDTSNCCCELTFVDSTQGVCLSLIHTTHGSLVLSFLNQNNRKLLSSLNFLSQIWSILNCAINLFHFLLQILYFFIFFWLCLNFRTLQVLAIKIYTRTSLINNLITRSSHLSGFSTFRIELLFSYASIKAAMCP